tara:strand:- start:79 stop:243 length:165 start_codon:yes stop_codon:yes gene_type:complete
MAVPTTNRKAAIVSLEAVARSTWMVKAGGIGGFGGGSLEHPRKWLGAQRPRLLP